MRFIKTNKEEVQNVRFLSDHEMVIGNNVWDYESSRGMLEALWLGIRSCLPHCNEFGEFEYFPFDLAFSYHPIPLKDSFCYQ